ncbi:hypothetical protein CA13_37360 [Planctomycetes bacterium CA13]|uniref:Uncharacterized protein n=1 Tax=Novipirellula herctigrandis TaxID=2527986 RepID=A0A5C5Z4V0_9BACT|nr:hypothetical protein CA13_37360 [Planctomycetes bacterium CA13]
MMTTIAKWMTAPILVASMALVSDAPSAEAGNRIFGRSGIQISFGGYGSSFGSTYGSNYGYRSGYPSSHYFGPGIQRSYHSYRSSYRPSYRSNYGHSYRSGGYHDTSHYDWHPTEVRRHGNHYHVQPGHYDWHQSGHHH